MPRWMTSLHYCDVVDSCILACQHVYFPDLVFKKNKKLIGKLEVAYHSWPVQSIDQRTVVGD